MIAIVARLLDRVPKRIIQPDCPDGKVGRPLMTRYFLFRRHCFAVFLHHFHRSDLDEFHDHPWSFLTFLLSGGYFEHVPTDDDTRLSARVWRRRFSILWRPAEHQHFIELDREWWNAESKGPEIPVWTLVLRFKKRREWGFIKNGIWTEWRKFEDLKSRSICEEFPQGESIVDEHPPRV